eukprot:scaffold10653_cov175-Amphora_coffeaeformis.AAC.7
MILGRGELHWRYAKAGVTRMATVAAAVAKTALTPPAPPPSLSSVPKMMMVPTPLFTRVQTGLGHLVAQASKDTSKITCLVNVSHQAPFRWIPLRSSAAAKAGAAVVYGSNYGGGLLPGDSYETTIHVKPHARLGLLTQGSNRVYKQMRRTDYNYDSVTSSSPDRPSCITANYTVDADGLLVVAPDPMTPFGDSALKQKQSITLHPDGNLCFIDWVAAGRLAQAERWQQKSLSSRTEFKFTDQEQPILIDAIQLRDHQSTGMNWSNTQFNAYATLVLHGERLEQVKENCLALQTILASQFTSTRSMLDKDTHTLSADLDEIPSRMAGPVVMGVTPDAGREGTMVVRLAATANEDLYRVFHTCLAPLTGVFGHQFYHERIRAVHSAAVPFATVKASEGENNIEKPSVSPDCAPMRTTTSPTAHWLAHVLTDSSLPTGGFAHSAGLEAAAQLKIVQNVDDIEAYVHATVQSTLQLVTPTLASVHEAVKCNQLDVRWKDIHEELQAMLVANGPACRASLDQGTSLLRLARQWPDISLDRSIFATTPQAHYAPVFGVVTATSGLSLDETRHLLAYTTARDVVSTAVRLNLLGPLATRASGTYVLQQCIVNKHNLSSSDRNNHVTTGPLIPCSSLW